MGAYGLAEMNSLICDYENIMFWVKSDAGEKKYLVWAKYITLAEKAIADGEKDAADGEKDAADGEKDAATDKKDQEAAEGDEKVPEDS